MGVRIIEATGEGDSRGACLYCSTTMWAFGPIFEDADTAQAFLDWIKPTDPRVMNDNELELKYLDFLAFREKETQQGE